MHSPLRRTSANKISKLSGGRLADDVVPFSSIPIPGAGRERERAISSYLIALEFSPARILARLSLSLARSLCFYLICFVFLASLSALLLPFPCARFPRALYPCSSPPLSFAFFFLFRCPPQRSAFFFLGFNFALPPPISGSVFAGFVLLELQLVFTVRALAFFFFVAQTCSGRIIVWNLCG